MKEKQCKSVIEEIFIGIFGEKCILTIDEVLAEFAFDVRIPNKVIDIGCDRSNAIDGG